MRGWSQGRWRRSVALAGVAVALLLPVAGCGEGSQAADGQLSKAEFQRKAKELCKARGFKYLGEAQAAFSKAEAQGKEAQHRIELDIISSIMVREMHEKLDAVRALKPPPGDKAQVDRVLDAIEAVVAGAEASPARFLYRQTTFKHPFHAANELAKGYGLSACARV